MTVEKIVQLVGAASILLVLLRVFVSSVALLTAEWSQRRVRRDALAKFSQRAVVDTKSRPRKGTNWQGRRKFRVVRRSYETADGSVCSFHLMPLDRKSLPTYRPGQFLTFDVPNGLDGHVVKRCYSLSSAPPISGAPTEYRVTIKRLDAPAAAPPGTPPGMASHHFHNLADDAVVDVFAPSGHFFLDQSSDRPIVFITGGVGITPILSMLDWVLDAQPQRQVWLFFGVRNRAEHIMFEHLHSLRQTRANLRCLFFYSRPSEDCRFGVDYDVEGHVNVRHLSTILNGSGYQFYICGPDAMMQTIIADLAHWGVPDADVFFESFGSRRPAGDIVEPDAGEVSDGSPIHVEFARSQKRAVWTNRADSLLELAELSGINVRYGCRAGGCGTCELQVLEGEIAYLQRPVIQPKPGRCLACIARPVGNVVLDV
ncbi:MAG: 2Fe-2S iron-sulfur cluster-binding protein [Hyphomicrobiaceae bacterium]